jgi:hypothetical protein
MDLSKIFDLSSNFNDKFFLELDLEVFDEVVLTFFKNFLFNLAINIMISSNTKRKIKFERKINII